MGTLKAVQFEVSADFGFFRNPGKRDIEDVSLTFNFMPKTAALGICGAILGLEGYKDGKNPPKFLEELADFKIAIMPIYPEREDGKRRPFAKTIVGYNNTHGYGNKDGTWQRKEQVLIKPAYRITAIAKEDNKHLTDLENKLKKREAVFRPYLGKNEFLANINFICTTKVTARADELVSCESIFPFAKEPPKDSDAELPSFWIEEPDYPFALEEGQYVRRRFRLKDGETYQNEADGTAGEFYKLEDGGVVFAF